MIQHYSYAVQSDHLDQKSAFTISSTTIKTAMLPPATFFTLAAPVNGTIVALGKLAVVARIETLYEVVGRVATGRELGVVLMRSSGVVVLAMAVGVVLCATGAVASVTKPAGRVTPFLAAQVSGSSPYGGNQDLTRLE